MKNYSEYTGIDTRQKIKLDAYDQLEDSLNGYAYDEVVVSPNGVFDNNFDTHVIFFQKGDSNGESKKVIGRISEIERGNYINHNNEFFLVTTKPEDNGTYRKAEVEFCQTVFPLQEKDKEVLLGTDKWGRPIVELQEGVDLELPCVITYNSVGHGTADDNEEVNLLNVRVTVKIPYRESESLNYDELFTIYGEEFRIIRLDKSKSVNGIGLLIITGERLRKSD